MSSALVLLAVFASAGRATALKNLDIATAVGVPTTLVADGPATSAAFLMLPMSVAAVGTSGNVAIADAGRNALWRVRSNGATRKLAGGAAPASCPSEPVNLSSTPLNIVPAQPWYATCGIVGDGSGGMFYSDSSNHVVRHQLSNGTVISFAGKCNVGGLHGDGGPASLALLRVPVGIAIDQSECTISTMSAGV